MTDLYQRSSSDHTYSLLHLWFKVLMTILWDFKTKTLTHKCVQQDADLKSKA